MAVAEIETIGLVNWFSLLWFGLCWMGYSLFSRRQAKKTACLASVLHVHRINWMRRLLQRDIRVGDAALIGNLERNVTFFASSSVLILAGLVTGLSVSERIHIVLAEISFASHGSVLAVELKLLTLMAIFIYAFFTFTWSMRQFGFASVLIGAAPMPDEAGVTANERRNFAIYSAKVIDQASHSYNYGMRSFYFSLAVLTWFVSPWVFILAATTVIGVLYEREFLSKSLDSLKKVENVGEKLFEDDKDLYRRSLLKTSDKSKDPAK